jgi:hypothetical protein
MAAWYQRVGCAFAEGWQVDVWQEVVAAPPLNCVVPEVPWQPWQYLRSCFAVSPWNALLVGLTQVAPRA